MSIRKSFVSFCMVVFFGSGCASNNVTETPAVRPATPPAYEHPSNKLQKAQAKPVSPEQRKQADISAAKAAAVNDPLNWRVFNELGMVYCRHRAFDQAVAAFRQSLALHPITTVVETEARHEAQINAQRAALEAKRQADIQRAKDLKSQQELSNLFGLVVGAASLQGKGDFSILQPVMDSLGSQLYAPADGGVPPLSPQAQFESSLKSKSEMAGIYANLGIAYFGKKDYQQSVSAFDTVLQLDPSRTDVLKHSAEAFYLLCKYDDCVESLARYHAIGLVEPTALLRLFTAYRALGMEAEADKTFATFLSRYNPASGDSAALVAIGAACLSNWRYRDGLRYLEAANRKAGESAQEAFRFKEAQTKRFGFKTAGLLMAAEAHTALDDIPTAITLLREAIATEPSPKAWYMLARSYDEIGDAASAAEAHKRADALYGPDKTPGPQDHYIYVSRAATGDGDAAISALQSRLDSVALTPGGGADQWCLLGFAYEKAGRIPEALEILNRCYEVSPAYARARQTLARLGKATAGDRSRLLAAAADAWQTGNPEKALSLKADAYRLSSAGKEKEEIRRELLKSASGLDPVLAMTVKAQDHYLRGSVALKSAQNAADVGRALSEFQWAVYHSPWAGELYFSTSAAKNLQNRTTASVRDLKLYLTAVPASQNVDDVLRRLYELEYQHEQKRRGLTTMVAF